MQSKPSPELLSALRISQATYYRWKKAGKLEERLATSVGSSQAKEIPLWQRWRGSGLFERPWSDTYKTHQTYQIKRYFCRFPIVSADYLAQWLGELPLDKQSQRQDRHSAVSSFARYLLHKGDMQAEEYDRIVKLYPKKSPYYRPEQRVIYAEDLQALISAAEKGHVGYNRILNRALLVFMSETALRVSEVCQLTQSSLRFSESPKEATVLTRGKGGKTRIVPFSKEAQAAIRAYLDVRPSALPSPLFYSFNAKHGHTPLTRDCVARRFRQLAEDTGVAFSAHSLRHYRITQWANNPRIPITVTQRWAGHSSLEVTQRYIHIRDEDAMEAAYE